jgi:hypothetical protein
MQIPSIFDDTKKARLEFVEARIEAIDEEDDATRDRKTESVVAGDEAAMKGHEKRLEELAAEKAALESEQELLEQLKEIGEQLDAKVRPALAMAAAVAEQLPGPVAEILSAFTASTLAMWEKLDPTHKRYRKLIAAQRFNAYTAYAEAGFAPEQAMALVLAEVPNGHPFQLMRENLKVNLKSGD